MANRVDGNSSWCNCFSRWCTNSAKPEGTIQEELLQNGNGSKDVKQEKKSAPQTRAEDRTVSSHYFPMRFGRSIYWA
ncbi:MAG: hypothetical protein KFB93_05945 [Simkaniaceae bacterium]|nr:MAG: hypothetical protein KFB93_05945 [Simkaniaceae bacterium]